MRVAWFRKRWGWLVVLLLAPLSVAWQAPEGDLMTWSGFLRFLSQPNGIALVVGVLLSLGVEYVPQFRDMASKWKRAVFFGVSLAVPLVAAGLGVLTEGWDPTWGATFWPAIIAGVLAFGSGTMRQGYLPDLPNVPPKRQG